MITTQQFDKNPLTDKPGGKTLMILYNDSEIPSTQPRVKSVKKYFAKCELNASNEGRKILKAWIEENGKFVEWVKR